MTAALGDLERPARAGRAAPARSVRGRSSPDRPEPEPPVQRLEELLLTRVANENPALGRSAELVDDRPLATRDPLPRGDRRASSRSFADGAADGCRAATSLIELMRTPARQRPDLAGRPAALHPRGTGPASSAIAPRRRSCDRLDLAIGVLAEEERALHLRFGGGPAARGGDAGRTRRRSSTAADEAGGVLDRFGLDAPGSVLIAKSTYVWLDQLSRVATAATSGRSTRSPTRSSTRSRAGASPACG